MNVKCIDGSVDGLSEDKDKEYIVTNVFVRDDGIFYGLTDDYGVYNEFKENRFIGAEKEKLDRFIDNLKNLKREIITTWDDVTLSIKLS